MQEILTFSRHRAKRQVFLTLVVSSFTLTGCQLLKVGQSDDALAKIDGSIEPNPEILCLGSPLTVVSRWTNKNDSQGFEEPVVLTVSKPGDESGSQIVNNRVPRDTSVTNSIGSDGKPGIWRFTLKDNNNDTIARNSIEVLAPGSTRQSKIDFIVDATIISDNRGNLDFLHSPGEAKPSVSPDISVKNVTNTSDELEFGDAIVQHEGISSVISKSRSTSAFNGTSMGSLWVLQPAEIQSKPGTGTGLGGGSHSFSLGVEIGC